MTKFYKTCDSCDKVLFCKSKGDIKYMNGCEYHSLEPTYPELTFKQTLQMAKTHWRYLLISSLITISFSISFYYLLHFMAIGKEGNYYEWLFPLVLILGGISNIIDKEIMAFMTLLVGTCGLIDILVNMVNL